MVPRLLLAAMGFIGLSAAAVAQGLEVEDPAVYAGFARTPAHRAFLPVAADLSDRFPTPGDQGKQSSCVAWAVGYAARSYYARVTEGAQPNSADAIVSPAYLYNTINDNPRNCTNGTRISDALGVLQQQGALSLAEYGYRPDSCAPPPPALAARATRFRIKSWRVVDQSRVDEVKGQIARGNPVVFGAQFSSAFNKLRGDSVYSGGGEDWQGGHAMAVVGYDDRRQAFKIINSWGKDWAADGYGWVAYETFAKRVRSAFVMEPLEAAPAPKPSPPTPAPSPLQPPQPKPPVQTVAIDPPLASYACAELSQARRDGRDTVTGFVGSEADLKTLEASLAGRAFAVDVKVHVWPQCEALMTFRAARLAAGGPKIRLRSGRSELNRGEPVVIEVTAPDYPSYLYLSYVQASGEVVHLIQPAGLAPTPLAPGRTIVLGDGAGGGPRFTVEPPFGDEMIVVLAAASPLFDAPRPATEIERDYLTAFRKALLVKPDPNAPDRVVRAGYLTLKTKEGR